MFFPLPVDKPFQDSQKLDCTKNALIGVQTPPHFFFKKVFFCCCCLFLLFFPFFLKLCAKNIGLLRFSSCVSQESHRTKSPVLDVRTLWPGKKYAWNLLLKGTLVHCIGWPTSAISALGKLRQENAKDGGPSWAIYIVRLSQKDRNTT